MSEKAADSPFGLSRLAYFGIFLWSLAGAYLSIWFKPKLALPFIALTGALFLTIPMEVAFFGTLIFAMAHNAAFDNPFAIQVGGFGLWYQEICLVFVFITMLAEMLTRRIKLWLSPMFFLQLAFLLVTLIQSFRGYVLGYEMSYLRTTIRNALYPIMVLPIGFYFGSGGSVAKFIKVIIWGWCAALVMYFLMYLGIYSALSASLEGRLAWPPSLNVMLIFPLLLILVSTKSQSTKDSIMYWAIVLISAMAIIATQTRSIWVTLLGEFIITLIVMVMIKPRGEKLKLVLMIFFGVFAAFVIGILILKLIKGDSFDLFIKTVVNRALSLFEWRKDIAIASRRQQMFESLKMVQRNWLFGRGVGVKWYSLLRYGYSRIDGVYFMLLGHQGLLGVGIFLSTFILWLQRSLFLVSRHKKFDDPLVLAFVLAQPAFIAAILINGIPSSSAYVIPTNVIVNVSSAMITERIYRDIRAKERPKDAA